MRLKLTVPPAVHTDVVSAVGWNISNDLFSASDEKTVYKWDINCESQGKACTLDSYCTDLHWFPVASKRQQAGNDIFAVACTDGSFKIIAMNGRVEKTVADAHKGAVISLRWSYEGTALVTAGEDGVVKVWSRSGMLRMSLATSEQPVYSVSWGPDSDQVLYTDGKDLIIKPLQPSSRQLQWKAHDGVVLKADWNPLNNLIVSGGEDCRFKVWDCYGRLLFQSIPGEYVVTSVAWCPDGEVFAVGSFNEMRLCDKTGWTCTRAQPRTGSILNLAWTADGTQVAGAGGNGTVCFGEIISRQLEWRRITATLEENNHIRVRDVLSETVEELDFRDRIIKVALGFGHLIAATVTQCCIYNTNNWNTPHIFDLKDTVTLIVQCERAFLMVDNFTGIQLYSYEGRQTCNPKFQGLRTEFLNAQSVSLSNDVLALIDRADSKSVRFFDTAQGKPIGNPITHTLEITEIALNQMGSTPDRKLVFTDRNRDMFITPILKAQPVKLGTMVDSFKWNDETDMLGAMMDSKLVVWYYPNVVFVDKDLLARTKVVKDGSEFGKAPTLLYLHSSRVTVQRSDGALVSSSVSPYPEMMYEHALKNDWSKAVRLCRFVRDQALWACLAAMAINARDLNTAEIAYAAIEEVDKLQYILHIKNVPTEEGRSAELCLFRRRPDEAEAILLQAGLIYRAIELNMTLYNWDRALELAVSHKTHVDTVIWRRNKHLTVSQRPETNQRFLQFAEQVTIEEDKIKAKIEAEEEKEKKRPGAKRYV